MVREVGGDGGFEALMRNARQCVEERGGYELLECFVDGSFAKALGLSLRSVRRLWHEARQRLRAEVAR